MSARLALGLVLLLSASFPAASGGELYGTIVTRDGGTLVGPIRWDHNENFWDDMLDAHKRVAAEQKKPSGFRVSVFGWQALQLGGGAEDQEACAVPFGHIRMLESQGNAALLTLKTGELLELEGRGSTDLGPFMRAIVIDDVKQGSTELEWEQIQRVELRQGPAPGRDRSRLHGTVETASGPFTGFIVWDADESLDMDVLDGEENGVERKIPLAQIQAVRPLDRHGSSIRLKDGKEVILRGTNDVDADHRGMSVSLAGIGRVDIPWRLVKQVTFSPAPPSPAYATFDGGRTLSGKVRLKDGRELSGRIVWDRDEASTWEILDGSRAGVDYSIPFSNVDRVKRVSPEGSEVRLRDGRTLVLSGTADVSDQNRGLVVTTRAAVKEELPWCDVDVVLLDPLATAE